LGRMVGQGPRKATGAQRTCISVVSIMMTMNFVSEIYGKVPEDE
jgi:hypothetical protein